MTFPDFVIGTISDFYLLFQEYLTPQVLPETAIEHLWEEDVIYIPAGNYQASINLLGVMKWPARNIPDGSGAWDIWAVTEGYGFQFLISPVDELIIILSSNEKDRNQTSIIKIIMDWITG
jgi:hypothetical protein